MPVRPDSTIVQSATCLSTDVGEDTVLMSVERGLYLALDPIGRDIWRRIATPRTVEDLCGALLESYDAPRDTIAADVTEMLDILVEAGVIEVTG